MMIYIPMYIIICQAGLACADIACADTVSISACVDQQAFPATFRALKNATLMGSHSYD